MAEVIDYKPHSERGGSQYALHLVGLEDRGLLRFSAHEIRPRPMLTEVHMFVNRYCLCIETLADFIQRTYDVSYLLARPSSMSFPYSITGLDNESCYIYFAGIWGNIKFHITQFHNKRSKRRAEAFITRSHRRQNSRDFLTSRNRKYPSHDSKLVKFLKVSF